MLCRLDFSYILTVNCLLSFWLWFFFWFFWFCFFTWLIVSYNLKMHLPLYLLTSTIPESWKITLAVMIQRGIYQSCCRLSWQGILMFSGRKACKTDTGYKAVRIFDYLLINFMLFCKSRGLILTTNMYGAQLLYLCLALYLIVI